MKKILSTLVMCLILGVGSVWAVDATLNVTIKTVVRTSPTDPNGEVVANVCTQEIVDGVVDCADTKSGYWYLTASMEVPASHRCAAGQPDHTKDYKNKAIILSGSANLSSECSGGNYVFSHWEASSGVTINNHSLGAEGICSFSVEKTQGDLFEISSSCRPPWTKRSYTVKPRTGVTQTITFTAVWIQPQVTDVDNANYTLPKITDVNDLRTQDIVFSLVNDLAKSNYTCLPSGNGFALNNTAWNASTHTYTATAAYTPSGVHGTHIGTVTLTSNYPSSNPTYATSTLTVEEDYTPAFTVPATFAVSTQEQPTNVGAYTQRKATDIVPTELNYAAGANGSEWDIQLADNPSGFFSLELVGNTKMIRFTPTGTVDANTEYTAKLQVKCTYYDAVGTPISTTKDVSLTAYAKNDANERLEIEGSDIYAMDFGNTIYGKSYTQTVSYVAINLAQTPQATWTATSDQITYTNDGSSISISLSKNLTLGQHTAQLVYTSGSKTATLNVSANVVLGTPDLTAHAGLSQITLTWTPVYGADKYIIKRDDSPLVEIKDPAVTSYLDENLKNGTEYSYTITAVYGADENKNTTSNIVKATPNVPETITVEDLPYLGLYTGTNKFIQDDPIYGTFPYSEKRLIDLSKTFDAYGSPLFDELYIFGVTTNTEGGDAINLPSTKLGCNAKTPLYVYTKSGNEYVKTAEYDAVSTRFDHGASKNGQHLYFTGYCPFAYMGVNATEEGWMYFKDDGNEEKRTVDIYLDNCEIMGRYKTPTGMNANYNKYTLILTADIGTLGGTEPNNSFLFGASSPFIFTSARISSSEPYQPTIHIAGQNHLQGQLGSLITNTEGHVDLGITSVTMDAGINNVYTYSAPITIKPLDLSTFTDLVMTDIWKDNTITNGYLKLDATKPTNSNAEKVVAIDLGSKNGSLTINGGQYHLRNSAADGTYACNLAIGYRRFSKLVEKDVPIFGGAVKVLLHLYGFGGDVADCKVIINSGTFTMYKNMYMSGTTPLGSEYYKDLENFLDLRLPAGEGKSQINGGTFNGISNVLMCSRVITTGASPENARGNWLCLQDVTIPVENQQPNGTATFDIPDPFHKGYGSDPKAVCYNMTNGDLVVQGREYGAQSLNFYEKDIDGDSENEKVVSLLLPGQACRDDCVDCEYQKEAIIFQWATAIPRFQAAKTVNGKVIDVNVGGSINVEETPLGEDMEYKTTQLLYMDCAGMENYSMNLAAQGATLTFDDKNLPRGQVGNENDYWILRHLNILKSVQADTWYTFTAPFDVHDISVIETSENTIKNKTRTEALELQAKDNLQLLYGWQDVLIPNEEGRASSFTLEALLGTRRKKLVHYDGTNIMTANYYLYELENEVFSTTGTGENLAITWKPVKRSAGEPLMYQGKTYAIQFPWCPMCNDLETRTYYDYWSNKMILFHGKGPQTVLGTTGQSSLSTAPAAGSATLAGNSTLADMTLAKNTAYVHNMTNDYFELNNAQYVVKPTEGFLLYNPGASPMPARISRSGKIEYDENVETGVDGVPTINDRTSLMLFGAYDGFEILSLCEQLITVYNLQGNIIFQQYMAEGEQVYVGTGAGIFVVRGESETIKVMVE